MAEERRLAAIVVADVVGFSRLMAEDEDGTLSALRAHRNTTEPVILNHGGRIVKTTGDGLLMEYPSAVAALTASIEIQQLMADRNTAIPAARRMLFRIGINVGDVIVDESGDIFGDGVNVAARLEAIAAPGGIALSNAVREAGPVLVEDDYLDGPDNRLRLAELDGDVDRLPHRDGRGGGFALCVRSATATECQGSEGDESDRKCAARHPSRVGAKLPMSCGFRHARRDSNSQPSDP